MEIKTKFDINNLVVSKYQRNPFENKETKIDLCCYEVMEIITETCIAGTQTFYRVRVLHGLHNRIKDFMKEELEDKFSDIRLVDMGNNMYVKMREDELVEAPKEVIDFVLNC